MNATNTNIINDGKVCLDFVSSLKDTGAPDMSTNPVTNKDEENKRVVDLYGRKDIEGKLTHFIQHSVARKVNPDLNVILDWLYGKTTVNEDDDFVRIERLSEMVKDGQIYPAIILEVLDYARKVELAALDVNKEFASQLDKSDSLKRLRTALSARIRKDAADAAVSK